MTMNINMPSKDNIDKDNANKARESTAVTILIGAKDEVYYFLGMIDSLNPEKSYNDPNFLKKSDYAPDSPDGLRTLLLEKNKGTYEKIQELKKQKENLQINDTTFTNRVKEIQTEAMKDLKIAPTVMIKPTDQSTYKNLVDVLDEMLVCNIGAYAIVDITDGDRYLLYMKTKDADPKNAAGYLTDKQRAEGGISN